jgi:hypothetical protein
VRTGCASRVSVGRSPSIELRSRAKRRRGLTRRAEAARFMEAGKMRQRATQNSCARRRAALRCAARVEQSLPMVPLRRSPPAAHEGGERLGVLEERRLLGLEALDVVGGHLDCCGGRRGREAWDSARAAGERLSRKKMWANRGGETRRSKARLLCTGCGRRPRSLVSSNDSYTDQARAAAGVEPAAFRSACSAEGRAQGE